MMTHEPPLQSAPCLLLFLRAAAFELLREVLGRTVVAVSVDAANIITTGTGLVDASASSKHLLANRIGHTSSGDIELHADALLSVLTQITQDLERATRVADQTGSNQLFLCDFAAVGELGQLEDIAQVDGPESRREVGVRKPGLLDAAEVWRLATFKLDTGTEARTTPRTIMTTAGRLADTAGSAATNALPRFVLANYRRDFMNHHRFDSLFRN